MPMQKRILCMLLAVLIVLSLIPAFALTSQAASNMKTGEECIQILKEMEGFVKYPIWDHSHYSVGYGSSCEKDDYPNGITEEEADALLRQFLSTMEGELNKFADRHGILFSQNQFDALMLFTYNCGTGWLYGNGDFRQAVLDNATGNDFIFYMSQWSAASGELHLGLVNRRLIEADMYLNGSYTNVKPANYTYVLFNNNGGDGSARVQGYDSNLIAYVKSTPTRDGYKFLGWYSEAEGGSWITELSAQNAKQTLYAHWQGAENSVQNPVTASYQLDAYLLSSLNIYDVPNGTVTDKLDEDDQVHIQGEYVDENGAKWGKLSSGSWINLGDPRIGAGDETENLESVTVKVTGDYVNIRIGPGTKYKPVAYVMKGEQLELTRVQDVDGVLWGRFRAGWICLQYTDYTGGLTPDQPDESDPGETEEEVIATGTVISDGLNIRDSASASGYLMGSYRRNERVEILEKTTVGGTPWGRTDKGWICLTFVKLDPEEEPETTVPQEPETTEPEVTEPETTEPEEEEKPAVQGIPATVTSNTMLNIRADAGTNYAQVGAYSPGQKIVILEQKSVGNVLWGRTDKGWVSMQYVRLDESWKNDSGVYAVVNSAAGLNIRSGPGVAYRSVGGYPSGTRIVVLEQTVVSGQKWGRTDKGWVSMDYVRLESAVTVPDATEPETTEPETTEPETTEPETTEPETTEPETTEPETTEPETTAPEVTEPETTEPGTTEPEEEEKPAVQGIPATVTSNTMLNIRADAGTNYAQVGAYSPGQKIVILEQKSVGNVLWGRTDKGWVSMQYVRLDESWKNDSGVYAVVNSAAGLNIRSGPGVAYRSVGGYPSGTRIVVLEQTVVSGQKWGRTDKGWVSMDYVRLESVVTVPDVTEPEITEPETTEPETTEPEVTQPQEKPDTVTGTVTANYLNVRNAAGTTGKIVSGYSKGTKVTILEKTLVNGTAWGRTDKGWISLAYVDLDVSDGEVPFKESVITATVLCIRKGPGTGNAVVGTYTQGQKVTILETAKVGTTIWGRTDKGWICMDYVK